MKISYHIGTPIKYVMYPNHYIIAVKGKRLVACCNHGEGPKIKTAIKNRNPIVVKIMDYDTIAEHDHIASCFDIYHLTQNQ